MRARAVITLVLSLLLGACASTTSNINQSANAQKAAADNVQLGSFFLQKGEYEFALDKLNKALAFDPDYAPAHTVLGTLYERIGKQENAGVHYLRAAELSPDDGDTQNNYGTWLCLHGRGEKADPYFQSAINNPFYRTPGVALTNAGSCMLSIGKVDKGETYLRKALEYNADNVNALYLLADNQYRKENYLGARAFLQRYEAVGETTSTSLMLGYFIEQGLGDRKSASRYKSEIHRRFPDSPEAKQLQVINNNEPAN